MPEFSRKIRDAEAADIVDLAELMNELGYSTSVAEMKARFENIWNHNDYKTLIAIEGGQIIGMVGITKNYSYEQNGVYARIIALITKSAYRQSGVGNSLVKAAENWASEIGATKVLVNCGNREERTAAHAFYKNLGYEVKSSGYVKGL